MTTPNDSNAIQRQMQQFLYAVSHDLAEPFRKVRTFSQRLAAKVGDKLDESARGDLQRILSAAEHGQAMIDGLLVLSRLQTNPGPVVRVDLNETLAAASDDCSEKIALSRAVVSIEPLPEVQADADQMRLLFRSLLDNSLKFQPQGRAPSVRVYAEPATAPGLCRIVVEDNGIGLERQYVDRVFTVFQRLHPRDVYPGLGLGLACCRAIVDRHQGSIDYDQRAEGGTRFIVTLPAATGETAGPSE